MMPAIAMAQDSARPVSPLAGATITRAKIMVMFSMMGAAAAWAKRLREFSTPPWRAVSDMNRR